MMRRIGIAALLLAAIGLAWWWWSTKSPAYSAAELQRLASLRVTGIGLLENDQPTPSIDAFQQLSEAFPDQVLGYRNLAVARLMVLQSLDRSADADRWQEAYQQAIVAVDRLRAVEPESAASHVLAARVATEAGDLSAAAQRYAAALELAPASAQAPIWFERFQLVQLPEAEQEPGAALHAIHNASAAAPRNTAALLELLVLQAEGRDTRVLETLERARDVLAPLDPMIQQRVRVSLLELLGNARKAAEMEDWEGVIRAVRMGVNVARPEESVRSDLSRLDRNVLEFVIIDFPDDFYQRHDIHRVMPTAPIPIQFVAEPAAALPEHASALDFSAADFDLDGWPDLIVLMQDRVQVWSRATAGDPWRVLVSHDLDRSYRSLLAADLDADAAVGSSADGGLRHSADLDLVLWGEGGWMLLENRLQQDGSRQLIAQDINSSPERVAAVVSGDLDLDGDLDLFVSSDSGVTVWINRGELRFEAWDSAALIGTENLRPDQATVVDWDRDIDLDILLPAANGEPAGYLENLRHGRLQWRPFEEAFGSTTTAEHLTIEDVDGNASWDLLACGPTGCQLTTTQTPTPGRVVAVGARPLATGSLAPSSGRILDQLDYDNDGALDLLVESQGNPLVLRHLGAGEYQPQPDLLPSHPVPISTVRSADMDRDGDLELLMLREGQLQILTNDGGNANHWIDVVLLAQQVKGGGAQASGRVNQYGYGSLLELKHGTTYQPRVVGTPATHFGIGQQDHADVVRIVWTNGVPQNVLKPTSNQMITEQQTLKGSCPYLYAWSGDGYAFVTDLLWSAPLGLQMADGTVAPDRPWEYLKIDGEALQPIDGEYRLQITEELWEVGYFDHVALTAVDHPQEVEIFTNEKVGPAALAEPKLHLVRQRRLPRKATDLQGRDVLEWIRAEDDQYLRGYEEKFCQGFVSPHYVELDLGDLQSTENLTLFLAGWIYPTDTSLNVQLSQDPARSGPRPPFLMAPDAEGRWREVNDFIGFPGGKTKTIAVDLSEIPFAGDDYRLRVCTSAEIYWDAIFFSVDPPAHEWVERPLTLESAELHYRGVSRRVPHPGNGPELYDYDQVSQAPAWPPMKGNFTRFGEVTELLEEVDDRLVVMGTGDEVTLRFAVPTQQIPEGWKRDFVIHCWGWDKDGDLNTIYGETAEPLPFRAMSRYPFPADAERPDSAPYRQYLQRFQSRQQPPGPFRATVRDFGGSSGFDSPQ